MTDSLWREAQRQVDRAVHGQRGPRLNYWTLVLCYWLDLRGKRPH